MGVLDKYPTDILKKLKVDFQEDSQLAITVFDELLQKYDYLDHPRIIRGIIFLAEGSLTRLVHEIETGAGDPRDVMYCAEYIHRGVNETAKRVRDFNNPFEENDLTPK